MHQFSTQTIGATTFFIVTLAFSLYGLLVNQNFLGTCMLHPYSIVRGKKQYTLLTSGLVHADFGHLFFNMFTYWFFAFTLEKYYIGTPGFVILYLAGLLLCDIPTIIKEKNNPGYHSLGASGAISAVLFCMIIYIPKMGISLFFIPYGIPAFIFGPLYLIYCSYASRKQIGNLNHDAHLYGALTGIVLAFALDFPEAERVISKITVGY